MYVASYRATENGLRQRFAAERLEARQLMAELARAEAEEAQRHADAIVARAAERHERAVALLAEMGNGTKPRIHTLYEIERRACILFDVKPSEIRGERRNRYVVFARQFVMYWAVRLTKLSLPQIGRLMGKRDHTTIMHGRDAYVEKRKAMGRTLRRAR